jgi:hypothetical protein
LWADPRSGLPVRVEVTARGQRTPILATTFLDLRETRPPTSLLFFRAPEGTDVQVQDAPDIARAVDEFSPFVLPGSLAGAPRRSRLASAAGTYGSGFDLVAVLALPEAYSPRSGSFLQKVPSKRYPWGEASVVLTPLINGMVFDQGEVSYILAGTVQLGNLERVAAALARDGVGERQVP